VPTYEEWLSARGLPNNTNNRVRYNIETKRFQNLRNQGSAQRPDWRDAQGRPSPYTPGGMNPPRVPGGAAGAAPAPPMTLPGNAPPNAPWPPDLPPPTPRGDPGDMRWRQLPESRNNPTLNQIRRRQAMMAAPPGQVYRPSTAEDFQNRPDLAGTPGRPIPTNPRRGGQFGRGRAKPRPIPNERLRPPPLVPEWTLT
jgi:hypothetical protein